MISTQMHRISIVLALVCTATTFAQEDPRSRRLYIRDGQLHRGSNPATLRGIETPDFFVPSTSDETIVKTFVRVSECGATAVWFNLEGLSADGQSIDATYVDGLRNVKSKSLYRSIMPVCRVLGDESLTGHEARLAAVRTVAKKFKKEYGMLYWIDGPDASVLVKEFKKRAPRLLTLATVGGDVDLVSSMSDAKTGRVSLVVGTIPERIDSATLCLMPAGDATYAAYEEASTDPRELLSVAPTTVGLTENETSEGFVSLFDGRSMDEWIVTGRDKEAWVIRDGTLEFIRPGGGVVRSRKRYDDFVLRLEWKLFRPGSNSGVFLRAPRSNRASKIGFEFQLMGDHGKEPGIHTTGAIYSVVAPLATPTNPVGEWNTIEIYLNGPKYKATLNGVVVQDRDFDDLPELKHRLRRGFIGLQDHHNKVAFRNIRIKEL